MNLKRGLNKKAQEGLTLTTLLLIVVGVVVAIVIILGATGILGKIFGGGEVVSPGALETAVQGCRIALQGNLVADYCLEFKEIGTNEYVTCSDSRIRNSITDLNPDSINCGSLASDFNEKKIQFCGGLTESKRAETKINGVGCPTTIMDFDFTCVGPSPLASENITITSDNLEEARTDAKEEYAGRFNTDAQGVTCTQISN